MVDRDLEISDTITHLLRNLHLSNTSFIDNSFINTINQPQDLFIKLFERRPCQLSVNYHFWIKAFHFIYSVSFGFNRHTIAIFIGNALPSFLVLLANLLSIKVICFSKSLKYLKQASSKSRRKSRLQNDLRAFLVIIIESFSIILISWGIPISLTMYHCGTLYVESIILAQRLKIIWLFFYISICSTLLPIACYILYRASYFEGNSFRIFTALSVVVEDHCGMANKIQYWEQIKH